LAAFEPLLPLNCLLGRFDTIAGLNEEQNNDKLPATLDSLKEVTTASQIDFFVQQIKISGIDKLEKAFNDHFMVSFVKKHGGESAAITQRNLTVVAHNSWR